MTRCSKDVTRLLKKLEPFVRKPVPPAPEHIPPMPQVEGIEFIDALRLAGYAQYYGKAQRVAASEQSTFSSNITETAPSR